MDHLSVLELHLSNERQRLAESKTEAERRLRTVWVAQYEHEVAAERAFIGLPAHTGAELDDAALLRELEA